MVLVYIALVKNRLHLDIEATSRKCHIIPAIKCQLIIEVTVPVTFCLPSLYPLPLLSTHSHLYDESSALLQ